MTMHEIEITNNSFDSLEFKYDFRDKQLQAIKSIAEGKTTLVVLPTGYGKTTIGLCLAYYCKMYGKLLVIASPLKALNSEHYQTFLDYGFRVAISDSDNDFSLDDEENKLENYDVIILTYEKNDSILRNPKKRDVLYDRVGALLVDEVHHVEVEGRGSNLESSIIKVKHLYPEVLICGLSATVGNPEDMAKWLGGELVYATPEERPVPLEVQYYPYEEICFPGTSIPDFKSNFAFRLNQMKDIILQNNDQYIAFFTSRARTRDVASAISDTKNFRMMLNKYNGTIYHNAGLTKDEREVAEAMFRNKFLRGICATPTLAQGVNLPARHVILFDTEQYSALRGQEILDANRLQQTIGRAGRPGFDKLGTAHVIVPTRIYSEVKERIENPLIVESRIPENANEIVLEWIVSNTARTIPELMKIGGMVFGSLDTEEATEWLRENGFIYFKDNKFEPTFYGRMTSLLYIKPETTLNYLRAEKELVETQEETTIRPTLMKVFLEVLKTDEYCGNVTVRREDEEKVMFAKKFIKDVLNTGETVDMPDELAKAVYLTFIDTIISKYKITKNSLKFISSGDRYTLTNAGERLLTCASIIIRDRDTRDSCKGLSKLVKLGKYKPEIVELLLVKGIGEKRAERLFKANIKTIEKFISTDDEELADIMRVSLSSVEKYKESIGEILKQKYEL